MKKFVLCLIILCYWNTYIHAENDYDNMLMMPDAIQTLPLTKSNNPKKILEETQSYLLEEVFISSFMNMNTSLLTDEEKEDINAFGVDSTYQDDIMKKAFANALAKQDVLGFKKLFKKYYKEDKPTGKKAAAYKY